MSEPGVEQPEASEQHDLGQQLETEQEQGSAEHLHDFPGDGPEPPLPEMLDDSLPLPEDSAAPQPDNTVDVEDKAEEQSNGEEKGGKRRGKDKKGGKAKKAKKAKGKGKSTPEDQGEKETDAQAESNNPEPDQMEVEAATKAAGLEEEANNPVQAADNQGTLDPTGTGDVVHGEDVVSEPVDEPSGAVQSVLPVAPVWSSPDTSSKRSPKAERKSKPRTPRKRKGKQPEEKLAEERESPTVVEPPVSEPPIIREKFIIEGLDSPLNQPTDLPDSDNDDHVQLEQEPASELTFPKQSSMEPLSLAPITCLIPHHHNDDEDESSPRVAPKSPYRTRRSNTIITRSKCSYQKLLVKDGDLSVIMVVPRCSIDHTLLDDENAVILGPADKKEQDDSRVDLVDKLNPVLSTKVSRLIGQVLHRVGHCSVLETAGEGVIEEERPRRSVSVRRDRSSLPARTPEPSTPLTRSSALTSVRNSESKSRQSPTGSRTETETRAPDAQNTPKATEPSFDEVVLPNTPRTPSRTQPDSKPATATRQRKRKLETEAKDEGDTSTNTVEHGGKRVAVEESAQPTEESKPKGKKKETRAADSQVPETSRKWKWRFW